MQNDTSLPRNLWIMSEMSLEGFLILQIDFGTVADCRKILERL